MSRPPNGPTGNRPRTDASAEDVYREYATIGTALQLPEKMWPADRAAFHEYWNRTLAGLEADEVAVRVARDLLYPSAGPAVMRLVMPLARLITAGLLPCQLRKDFRLAWNRWHRLCFERTINLLARVHPLLPQRLRHWPKKYYLGQLAPALGHPWQGRHLAAAPEVRGRQSNADNSAYDPPGDSRTGAVSGD
ncbi:oxygenase MpaB family protein [Arthrobacter sp. UYEF3]|uniref:oxygenase MpaB family protein n=1 Tax=Arthrobacter sp. UYEF3 TaxID=1756365 RepID=UPI00339A6511